MGRNSNKYLLCEVNVMKNWIKNDEIWAKVKFCDTKMNFSSFLLRVKWHDGNITAVEKNRKVIIEI